ncbi:MAG: cyclase family protein [Patescibacteria group bacterium]
MELSERTPVYPGDPRPEIKTIATIETDGWNERRFSFNTHSCTHIDAPFHMLADGKKLEEFPVENFVGRAKIIDVSGEKKIDKEMIGSLSGFDFVLFKTGQSKKAFDPDYYKNAIFLTREAAEELARQKIKIVGIDSFSPDEEPYNSHKILFRSNILILENLVNLDLLPLECRLYIMPLKLTNADGSPCRVLAEV